MADSEGGQSTADKQQESFETNINLEEEASEATQTEIETSTPETGTPAPVSPEAPGTETEISATVTETTATETITSSPVTGTETETPAAVPEPTATETKTSIPVTETEAETSASVTETPTTETNTSSPVTGTETETPAAVPEPTATETKTPIPVTETEAETPVTGTETPASVSQPEAEPIPESTTETPSVGAVAADPVTMSAVVIGGTGATGRCLIEYLLKNKRKFSKVTVIGRRPVNNIEGVDIQMETDQNRLIQHAEDMNAMSDKRIKEICEGNDVFFCCLGTTKRAAGSAEAFHQIDHDLTLRFIGQAKAANIPHCSYVSSTRANPNSMILYLRTKGEVEQGIQGLGFPYVTIMQPGLLNRGGEMRFVEKVANFIFHGIPVSTVAEAMAIDAYQYKTASQTQSEPSGNNVTVMTNADIHRTVQEDAARNNATN